MTFSRTVNSVTIDYSAYIASWMKQPRGFGCWAFFWGRNGEGEPHFFTGTLPDACRQAAREAKAAGQLCITLGS